MGTICFHFSTELLLSSILLYFFCFYNFSKPVLISDLNKIIKLLIGAFSLLLLGNICYLCLSIENGTPIFLFTAVSFVKFTKLTVL